MSVPGQYLGVWQRRLLRTRNGDEDTRSLVFWLQTDELHGDIRMPAGEGGLTTLGGFAGITRVLGERCQWHRLLDSNPASGSDIGLMEFQGSEQLIERALDDSYLEVWERLPASIGPQRSWWFDGPRQRHACLLLAGDYFFYARARRLGTAQPGDDSLFCLGRIQGLAMPWQITHSTAPARIGLALLGEHPETGEAAFDRLNLNAHHGWRRSVPPAPAGPQENQP